MADTRLKRDLPQLVGELRELARSSETGFSSLSATQLNWKPSPDQWSVAQCFDHLINSNQPYIAIFDQISKGEKKNTFWEKMPFLPEFFGGFLVKSLDPASKRKLKAPGPFQPSSSDIDGGVIERFVSQLNDLSIAMSGLHGKNLDSIKITSPALKLITYSLRDTCTILVVHGQRHFLQAQRVVSNASFPTS